MHEVRDKGQNHVRSTPIEVPHILLLWVARSNRKGVASFVCHRVIAFRPETVTVLNHQESKFDFTSRSHISLYISNIVLLSYRAWIALAGEGRLRTSPYESNVLLHRSWRLTSSLIHFHTQTHSTIDRGGKHGGSNAFLREPRWNYL